MALPRGYVRFLLDNVQVDDGREIKRKENENANKKKIIWIMIKKLQKNSLESTDMLTCCSVIVECIAHSDVMSQLMTGGVKTTCMNVSMNNEQ